MSITELFARGDVLVMTGAGISTDSGIPDYRGPGSTPRSPMTFQEFIADRTAQQRYWARAHLGWSHMRSATPNDGHRILAELHDRGRLSGLITQNVDTLHTRAGHPDVIELHGAIDRVICLACREISDRTRLHERLSRLNPGWGATNHGVQLGPDGDTDLNQTGAFTLANCESCDGPLKPDVIFFGENVPKPRVEQCFSLVDRSASLVVFGSSLHVMSGRRFVRAAAKRGIDVAIVNRGPARDDSLATIRLDAGVSETLRMVATQLDNAPGVWPTRHARSA